MKRLLFCFSLAAALLGSLSSARAQSNLYQGPYGPNGTWNLYEVFGNGVGPARTWADASAYANSLSSGVVGGRLVSINSAWENWGVFNMAGATGDTWIGLTDREGQAPGAFESQGTANNRTMGWAWTSGEAFDFQNWGGDEPNNFEPGGEDATFIRSDGLWNDHSIGLEGDHTVGGPLVKFVVEYPVGASSPIDGVQVSPTLVQAPFGPGGSWNIYERGPQGTNLATLSWAAADDLANSRELAGLGPGHLASIHSLAENNFVQNVGGGNTWMGLTDREGRAPGAFESQGTADNRTLGWAWTSGEAFSFQNWGDGEPNDFADPGDPTRQGEDAVVIAGGGRWNDDSSGLAPDHTVGGPANQYVIEYETNADAPIPGVGLFFEARPWPEGPAFGTNKINVREVINNGQVDNNVAAALATVTTQRLAGAIRLEYEASTINILDSGGAGMFGGDSPFGVVTAGKVGLGGVEDIGLIARGTIHIPNDGGGEYTFDVNSDDGFQLDIEGADFMSVAGQGGTEIVDGNLRFNAGRGAQDSFGHIVLQPGDYRFTLVFNEDGGGAAVELSAAKGHKTGFDGDFQLVGAPGQPGGKQKPFVTSAAGNWDVVILSYPDSPGNPLLPVAIPVVLDYWAKLDDGDPLTVPQTPLGTASPESINYTDDVEGGGGKGFPQEIFPGLANGGGDNLFAMGARGTLTMLEDSDITFTLLGDDSSILRLKGTSGWKDFFGGASDVGDGFRFDGCCGDVGATVFLAAGDYEIEVIWQEGGGGAYVGLWASMSQIFLLGSDPGGLTQGIPGGLQLVPEPSTMALASLGGLLGVVLGAWRRRRKGSC